MHTQKGSAPEEDTLKEVTLDVFIDMIYTEIRDNVAEEVCRTCPIVEYIGELRHTIKDMTHEQLTSEVGVFFADKKCPCIRNQ